MYWCDNIAFQGTDLGETHFHSVMGSPYWTLVPPDANQQHDPVAQLSLPQGASPWCPSAPWSGYYTSVAPVPVGFEPTTEVGGQHGYLPSGEYGYGASPRKEFVPAAPGLQTRMVGGEMRCDVDHLGPAAEFESVDPVQLCHQTPDVRRDLTEVSILGHSFHFLVLFIFYILTAQLGTEIVRVG